MKKGYWFWFGIVLAVLNFGLMINNLRLYEPDSFWRFGITVMLVAVGLFSGAVCVDTAIKEAKR